ncbi:MAG: serine/threonine protein kinase [Acidiferrobacterales bacterium]
MSISSLDHALPKGHMLHAYQIEKSIGGGGFSLVYLAIDTDRNRKVVIKEFLPLDQVRRLEDASVEYISHDSQFNDPGAAGIKRFFNEAAALAKVSHPNIVKVRDVFRANNTVYMVMDFHKGHDLRWYIKRYSGRLSEKFIVTVFPYLLEGLRELHENGLLHLDIKPANIHIRPGGKPLLLDFGAVRETMTQRARGPHTLTMGYAPIEQHKNGHIGPWTDMYAIGASMWACMSGAAPPKSLDREKKDSLKPAVKSFARNYSRQLLEAVDWCLQMESARRPQSVNELLDFMNKDWIDNERPSLWRRFWHGEGDK